MSGVHLINEESDNNSLFPSTNSDDDDDTYELKYHSCASRNRYTLCNRKKYYHLSSDSDISTSLSNKSKIVKGQIRTVDDNPRHLVKYDGSKWRRMCSNPDCAVYLNGSVFSENWLCRKHYSLYLEANKPAESDNLITQGTETVISTNEISRKLPTRRCTKNIIKPSQRGDIVIDAKGIRQKYTGSCWRPLCNVDNCHRFIVARGHCRRHDTKIGKKSRTLLSLDNVEQPSPVSESQVTESIETLIQKRRKDNIQQPNLRLNFQTNRSILPLITKPRKGDIQSVRQRWSGTKWYSLCRYPTQTCIRRSGGARCRHLCNIHYKEYKRIKKNPNRIPKNNSNSLSPIIKRKRLINNGNIPLSDSIDIPRESPPSINETEQSIQTNLTYPLEANDLREECILIEEDSDDQYQSESSQFMVFIKKEEESYLTTKRGVTFNTEPLPMNCKLEITKLEI